MSSIHRLLITSLPLLILLLCPAKSETIDPQYIACTPFECGHLNISYPFYVPPTRPFYCGLDGFNVSCNNRSQTIIKIFGDDYIINRIFYNNLTIHITNSAFAKYPLGCPSSIHSLLLGSDGRFNFTSLHSDIYLFQNGSCSRNIEHKSNNYTEIKCDDDENEHLILAVYGEDFNEGEFGNCGEKVIVPYYKDEVTESTSIEGILEGGIVLDYNANNCTHCSDSNGRCGFNATTKEFICFCPDKPHRSACHPEKTRKKWKIILPSVLSGAVLLLIILALLLIVYWQQRRRRWGQSTFRSIMMSFKRARSGLEEGSMRGVTVFSYNELEEATRTFDPKRILGEGGFGIVYYGKLKDGKEVAVKRLFEKNYKRIEQFKNEIKILTDLRHENLVALYGCTSRSSRELLLVYEYIPNGTVADHLHGNQTKPVLLPWSTRMKIAIETATALSYLHSQDIIHRDVKTNNILLDSNFSVKVADFGLSRLFPADVTHILTAPQGTPGYLDPEYHQCYHLTDKSDVYSFGVVLVELISSLPAVDVGRHRHEINLSNYAMSRIQRSAFNELVDPDLGFETDFMVRRMTTLVAELAFRCLQHDGEVRPSMGEVLEDLNRIGTMDYYGLEAEEMHMMSSRTTEIMKPQPSPTENDDVRLLRNAGQQPPSPVSVMDKWLNSSKSTTPATSRSS